MWSSQKHVFVLLIGISYWGEGKIELLFLFVQVRTAFLVIIVFVGDSFRYRITKIKNTNMAKSEKKRFRTLFQLIDIEIFNN